MTDRLIPFDSADLRALQQELHPDTDFAPTRPDWHAAAAHLAEGYTYQTWREGDPGSLDAPVYCQLCAAELNQRTGSAHDPNCLTLHARLLLERHEMLQRLREDLHI